MRFIVGGHLTDATMPGLRCIGIETTRPTAQIRTIPPSRSQLKRSSLDDGYGTTGGGPTMASQASQPSSRGFDLGNVATNRILFVLALLGVLLPLNALVAHYNHLGFIYYAPHEMTLKGPYDIHIQAFVYIMEGLLAVAVYLYGFEFIFGGRASIFQFGGNVFYALALIVPPTYFYLWLWALIIRAGNSHGPLVYWPIIAVSEIVFLILGTCMFYIIFKQLRITLSPAAASRN